MSASMGTLLGTSAQLQLVLAFFATLGVGLFGHGFALWRRRRRIEDTPTSKARSLSLGRVEIAGRARPGTGRMPLRAPISETPCVFFRFRVEEERRSGKSRSWQTIASGASDGVPFDVEDETGRVLVDPRGATLELEAQLHETDPAVTAALRALIGGSGVSLGSWLLGSPRIRVTEERVHDGDAIYVLGLAQPRPGAAGEARRAHAAELAALKRDPGAFARLDRDADGRVDADEWDAARRDVAARRAALPQDDPVVVARDPAGDAPFVVSAFGERALVRRLYWRSLAEGIGGAGLTLVSLAFLVSGCA